MKINNIFTKTMRESPAHEQARSAQLLLRAGYIYKEMAGVYDFLPLGLRVLENIKQVIRKEINSIEGQEIQMTTLQKPETWEKSGRYDDEVMDIWFKTKLNAGGELGLAPTHEEPITNMMKSYIHSYRDLPLYVYQFQTKFRNEIRAKSGILRTREFLMKDLYSFCTSKEEHEKYYQKVEDAYVNIYKNLGIGDDTYKTFASGGSFSKYSHEFQTASEVGEDIVWHNEDFSVVLNEEVLEDEVLEDLKVTREELKPLKTSEVGNIFTLGYKYSEALGLKYTDEKGEVKPIFMGSYGIGVSRVLGIIAEKFADEKGLVWPKEVAPYKFYVIGIGDEGKKKADEFEKEYPESVLLDDREDARIGEKLNDYELYGIPFAVVFNDEKLSQDQIEFKTRKNNKTELLTEKQFKHKIAKV